MWFRPSRWTLAAFTFAVVAGFVAWLILGRGDRTIRLTDGREFSIVAVTYGTNHVLEGGPPWARLLARGSRSAAYRFGYKSSSNHTSAVPSVMVWTRWSSRNTNAPPRFASVADATGAQTEPDYSCVSETVPTTTGGALVAWRFENYPRRQETFTLRFYEYDLFRTRVHQEGEAVVRNPVPARRTTSPMRGTPITSTNGTLAATLASLRCGGPPPRRPLTAKSAMAPWVTAEFEFRENGQPTTDWTIKRVEAFGTTGNYFTGDRLVVELEEGRRVARFTGAFWQDEPEWRLIAEVVPTRDVPAENLWTVRLPARALLSGALTNNLEAEARGRGLNYFRLAIEPGNASLRDVGAAVQRVVSLRANFNPAAPDLHVDIASAADDQGRNLRVTPSLVPRAGVCAATLELPDSTDFVDLTFAIQHSLKTEFHVRPAFASTNVSSTFPARGK